MSGGRLHVNDAAPDCDRDGVRAIVGTELAHNTLHVRLDGVLGNRDLRCHTLIRIACCDTSKHFDLTHCELIVGNVCRQLRSNIAANITMT